MSLLGKNRFQFILIIVVLSILAIGYWQLSRELGAKPYVKERVESQANRIAAAKAIKEVKHGDLIVRRGDDMTSYMLATLNKHDKRYSHCGIVVREGDNLLVIHSIGGEDNPNQKIKKEPIEKWVSVNNNLNFAVYRFQLADSEIEALAALCNKYYEEGRVFDMDFDLETDDRLYCSEMIYKALVGATDMEIVKEEMGYNRSFVGVDNLYMNSYTNLICQVEYK